jgi:hypothetical protein
MERPLSTATSPGPPSQGRPATFLAKVGTVAFTIVRHVPTRGISWGAFGLFIGILLSLLARLVDLAIYGEGGDELLWGWPWAIGLFVVPIAGTALFVMHGLHRGIARAALDLERRFGLVAYVVDRIIRMLEAKLGGPISNLPLAKFERLLKGVLDDYLVSDDMREGSGLTGWVLRAAKRAIVRRVEKYLLAAYRAEERPDGTGGGVSLEKVRERASAELSTGLGRLVMAPLNKQLVLFAILYVGVALFWFPLALFVVGLFHRS